MAVLGKEASAAMASVEAQQQRLTLHRLTAMVFSTSFISLLFFRYVTCFHFFFFFGIQVQAERTFHQRILQMLDDLEEEVIFYMLDKCLFCKFKSQQSRE